MSDLFGRVLQVVVEGDDVSVSGIPNAHQKCVVLAEVPHQPDAPDPGIASGCSGDDVPTRVWAPVIDEDDLVGGRKLVERGGETGEQQRQRRLGAMHGDDR